MTTLAIDITITLPFIQVVPNELLPLEQGSQASSETLVSTGEDQIGKFSNNSPSSFVNQVHIVTKVIDTQAPLRIQLKKLELHRPDENPMIERALVPDLLSIHLVRNVNGSTIISYHANMDQPTTKAHYLHERIRFAGKLYAWLTFNTLIFLGRPECLLGKDAGKGRRSHILVAHIHLASSICLG